MAATKVAVQVAVQFGRMLQAHDAIFARGARDGRQAVAAGDDGTNDLLVSEVIRTNERQVVRWSTSD